MMSNHLIEGAELVGKYEFPMLKRVDKVDVVATEAIPFERSYRGKGDGKWVHFYTHDAKFECIWNDPGKYLPILQKCKGVIAPDYSVYTSFSLSQQIWNTYRNRALAYWLQKNGVEVIPNVRWGFEYTYDWCFDGIPKGGTVAVGTNGCIRNKADRCYFKKGLAKMLKILEPETVIVYGSMPDDIFGKHLDKTKFVNIPHWRTLLDSQKERCS